MKLLILVCLLVLMLSLVEGSRRRYKSYHRYRPRHGYARRYRVHKKVHEYYEPTYERTYEIPYDEPEYDYEYEYEPPPPQERRITTTTGVGGLDLAAALGLTGVGYVANSGGALHIVGKREAETPSVQVEY